MSYSRSFMIAILQDEFTDPRRKAALCKHAITILKEKPELTSRIFDHFPCLLPRDQIKSISKKFNQIVSNIKGPSTQNYVEEIPFHDPEADAEVAKWLKPIISSGIEEILDHQGYIKSELIELLGWQEITNKLHKSNLTISILCAYVASAISIVITNPGLDKRKRTETAGVLEYISKNTRQLVIDQLTLEGYIFKTSPLQHHNDLFLSLFNDSLKPSSLAVLSAISTTSSVRFGPKVPPPEDFPLITLENKKTALLFKK